MLDQLKFDISHEMDCQIDSLTASLVLPIHSGAMEKNSLKSFTNSSGLSSAGKCPPWSCSSKQCQPTGAAGSHERRTFIVSQGSYSCNAWLGGASYFVRLITPNFSPEYTRRLKEDKHTNAEYPIFPFSCHLPSSVLSSLRISLLCVFIWICDEDVKCGGRTWWYINTDDANDSLR